jgi:hypothetical protein
MSKAMSDAGFTDGPVFCGQLQQPGLAVDFDLYVDYSNKATTDDQARIEAVLDDIVVPQNRVLHVGVGNSKLAKRFTEKGIIVDGITISETEQIHARSLSLDNYQVFIANKYHRSFVDCFVQRGFDYIVDNNLASFACCQYHFYQMIDNYLSCLKVGGKILTDQRGMDWALASPGFILGFDSLRAAVASLPVKVSRLTPMVYAIESLPPAPLNKDMVVYAKRSKANGQPYIESFKPANDK